MKKFILFLSVFFVITISIVLYGFFVGTKGLKIYEYKITNENLVNYHGLKIVHLSDIHYGSTVYEKELENLVNKVNELKPDIVVLTGDLIDKNPYDKDIISKHLNNITANVGKYAVSGNHDTLSDYQSILNNSNFKLIDDNYVLIYIDEKPIIISGISNLNTDANLQTETFDRYIGDAVEKPIYSILLVHEPDRINNINIGNYNLILAGHSHNGQVNIPFIKNLALPNNAKKYYEHYYKIENSDLYINSGVGTSIINMRLFNKPSINLYRLTSK